MNGYSYSDINLNVLHVTSAVQTDEAAIKYIAFIERWFPKSKVLFIEKRNSGEKTWRLIHRVEEQIRRLHVLPEEPMRVQQVPEVPGITHAPNEGEAIPSPPDHSDALGSGSGPERPRLAVAEVPPVISRPAG